MSKPRIRVQAASTVSAPTRDDYVNVAARLGWGTNNQSSYGGYANIAPITRRPIELESVYRTSWVARRVIDLVADDMVRAGISIDAGLPPGDQEELGRAMEALAIWGKLRENLCWGRLYGGSIAVMLIDGQDPATPLDVETVGPGGFKGLLVLDRYSVQPSFETIRDLGPDLGLPEFYDVMPASGPTPSPIMRIHHSRVIRAEGAIVPMRIRQGESGWTASVLEQVMPRLMAFDSATAGAAQLVFKAHLRIYKVKGYRDILAAGGKMEAAFLKSMEMIRFGQSIEGLTIGDMEDEFQTNTYSFGGLSDILLQFSQQVAGAAAIPLTRLFGQSPAGLNATGDSDIRIYHDSILAQQEGGLRRPLTVLLEVLHRSVLGRAPSKQLGFAFNALWQMSDKEKAEIAKAHVEAILAVSERGIISNQRALEELRASARITGVFGTITDEEVEAADEDLPEPPSMIPPGGDGLDATDPADREEQDGMPGQRKAQKAEAVT